MATEVTCGQCHGRLLIETLGVVVACPHCGVHLSIPAPPPEPVAEPEPVLERDTDIAVPPAPGSSSSAQNDLDPGDIELNFERAEQLAEAAQRDAPPDPLASSSVFGGLDEQHEHPAEAGWHSAPSLHLGQSDSPASAATTGAAPPPALFTSPLMDRAPDLSPTPATNQTVAPFPTFGEAARQADPAWNFAPAEAATSAPDAVFLSSSQQFSLGTPADESPDVSEQPMFSFGAPAGSSGFAPPAATPSAAASAPTITLPGTVADDLILSSSQQFSLGAIAATLAAVDVGDSGSLSSSEAPPAAAVLTSTTVSTTAAAHAEAAAASRQRVLMLLLVVVSSYASAITIVLIYVLAVGRAHQLESLPDLKPLVNEKGEVVLKGFISPKNDLPVGHVLKLGQSQRFGSVRVTPVKVTRGTVQFQHTLGKSALEFADTEPLLKLWLKFENVSQDQTFSPLDEPLVFKRSKDARSKKVNAHNFLAASENRKLGKSIFRVYDLPTDIGFDMVGQKLNTELPPGETWQTFVPSEEEAVELKGDLVWRVHLRKGYHPKSLRGVTTLIDVQFNSKDISNES